jgi:hypothetical protein
MARARRWERVMAKDLIKVRGGNWKDMDSFPREVVVGGVGGGRLNVEVERRLLSWGGEG